MLKKEKESYQILGYELYKFPKSMTDKGEYFGKTSLKEQAETVVRNAKAGGKQLFIKAVCSDGIKRFC